MISFSHRLGTLWVIGLFLFSLSTSSSTASPEPKQELHPGLFQDTILYVGGTGPGNYSTIQQAIDNASAGDMVFVYTGYYIENILIKTTIHLIGENNASTVIDGGGYGSVVTITADDTILQGFTIQNAKNDVNSAGVQLLSANNVCVIRNIVQNNGGLGLSARGLDSSKTTIEENTIRNNSYGIYIQDARKVSITTNNICHNGEGVYLIGSYDSRIMNNTIMNRGIGLHLDNSYDTIVSGNRIVENANGVYVFNSSNITFQDNNINRNRWYGLWIKDTTFGCIIGNRISDNIDVGLFLESSYDTTVLNNTLWDNDNGIYLKDSSGNVFKKNHLRNYKMNACFVAHTLIHRGNSWRLNYWERARLFPYPIFGIIKLETCSISWINFDWTPLRYPPQSAFRKQQNPYPSILYVGGDGPNNYSSIQKAIDDANDNDTIYVFNGTYYEMVLIDKPLRLIGENKTTTILEGNGTRDIVTIIADYVTITGFTVQNGHFNILINHSSYGTITGNNIDSGLHGVSVQNDCHFLTISNNSFRENVYGIRLFSSTAVTVSYNILQSFKINAFYFGTSIEHGKHHWYKNYWGMSRSLPYLVVGKIRIGTFSLTWLNIDWYPLRTPLEDAPIDTY